MKTKNSTVDTINKRLKHHGVNQYGDPLFRIVFSDDETERRNGTFTDYHNEIFIRTVTEIRELPKYPWIKEKWILERWASGDLAHHKDLVTFKSGVYVCIYVFQDKDNNYLPPLFKVAEIVVKAVLNPVSKAEMVVRDEDIEKSNDDRELKNIELEIAVASDESKTKDSKSIRETLSTGYGESNRSIR